MKNFDCIDDWIIYPNLEVRKCDIFEKRMTVKALIVNEDGKICLVTNSVHNFFLLPGGGVDTGELPEEAIVRECREEVGYEVEITRKLGEVQEFRNRDCKEYQTFLYFVKTKKKILSDERTPSEVANGLVPHWMNFQEALGVCEQQYQTLKNQGVDFYNTGFNIYRDRMFLLHAYGKGLEKIS
jgi:8-oxo-dGTP diphosphatase